MRRVPRLVTVMKGRRYLRTIDLQVDMKNFARTTRHVPYQVSMGSYRRRFGSKFQQPKYWITITVGVLLALIFIRQRKPVAYTHRRRFNGLPEVVDTYIGVYMHERVVDANAVLEADHEHSELVYKILEKLLVAVSTDSATEPALNRCKLWDWRFSVMDSNDLNACCFPGGRICVNRGLIEKINSEDKLALLIAHEVGHAIARHGSERLLLKVISYGLVSMLWSSDWVVHSLGIGTTIELPYSRANELEADAIGLHLAVAAGYQVDDKLINKTLDLLHETVPDIDNRYLSWFSRIVSTHPTKEERVQKLCALLPSVHHRYAAPAPVRPWKLFTWWS
eukprot:TRINITY_DN5933_c1_g2_i1.p1 TRINITY_DN5933_c1_g2~~TRINITY_DN5933_c1_g2_i1.p1  ORF type:complete len:336 (+),score=26.74 TRINITY_DN5933_c1_g2_i1:83-1090(+)